MGGSKNFLRTSAPPVMRMVLLMGMMVAFPLLFSASPYMLLLLLASLSSWEKIETMRIVSWNVNGIRAAEKKGFCDKVSDFSADIIGIQETKAKPDQVRDACKELAGFHSYASSAIKPGYSGVALFSKIEPDHVVTSLDESRFDSEGRFIAAFYPNFLLINAYFPNGAGLNGDNSRVPYKLAFYDAVFNFLDRYQVPKLVMGDFNTAHKEIDLARPKANVKTSGFLPIEREHFESILARGYVDTFRHFNKAPDQYTWWNMRRLDARARNVGWRIDGVLASNNAMPLVKDAFIWPLIMGSDHCPVGIELRA
jgi:exodeoxyribonuclease-3